MDNPSSPPSSPAVSFRDPGGRLVFFEGRVLRFVHPSCVPDLEAFLISKTAQQGFARGNIVGTRTLDAAERRTLQSNADLSRLLEEFREGTVLEHEQVFFPSYPYEWPPEMLCAAGFRTLDLAKKLLAEGIGLKDATPYNVLFQGPEPVFVDILSFERRDAGDPAWLPYAQFSRTILLPLLASRHFGWSLDQMLLSRRDGLEPEEIYRASGFLRKLLPPVLSLATIPTWLAAGQDQDDATVYQKKLLENSEQARFILGSIFERLRRQLQSLEPVRRKSTWSDYPETCSHYSDADAKSKQEFVKGTLAEFQSKDVLDVGCNTGDFSLLAARQGARVVAIDQDAAVVGEVWRRARKEKADILPLVVNLARPTPATGWRNREWPSFLERARGKFDAVVMLAVLHHIVVNERVPLEDIFDLVAQLTTDIFVIEFVAPEDPMFRRIVRGREHLFEDLTVESFEAASWKRFEVVRSQRLEHSSRWLYLLRKKS